MKLNPESNTTKKKSYPSLSDYNKSKNIIKALGLILTPLMIFSCSDKDIPVNKNKVQNTKVIETKTVDTSNSLKKQKEIKRIHIKTGVKHNIQIYEDNKLTKSSAREAITKVKKLIKDILTLEEKKNKINFERLTTTITIGNIGLPININILAKKRDYSLSEEKVLTLIKEELKKVKFPVPENPPINIKFTIEIEKPKNKLPILKEKKRTNYNKVTIDTIFTGDRMMGHPSKPIHKDDKKIIIIKGGE